ncbi:MAG: hypothetical protein KGV59_04045 [Tenacibaculum sp.]|nr:hypothetical protein [Tenacibaculum sp.]
MKKSIFVVLLLLVFSSFAQDKDNVKEPPFVGEAFIIKDDNSMLELDRERVKIKKQIVGLHSVGIGKNKNKIKISGCCSGSVYRPKRELKIVVKAPNNEKDPLYVVKVFKFKKKTNKRVVVAPVGTFVGGDPDNLDYLTFRGKRYGKQSYLLTIKNFDRDAEYGVIVDNPDSYSRDYVIVSTFGIK